MATNDNHPCPNCGHCPTCGRAKAQPYFVPYPWWGYYPNYAPAWINVGGGTYSTISVTSNAAAATPIYTFTAS